jgi:hypothetical protein
MIYTDGIHIISSKDVAELHSFARAFDIKRCWFHNSKGKTHPHYDIPKRRREEFMHDDLLAIVGAVRWVHSKELVKIAKETYGPRKTSTVPR